MTAGSRHLPADDISTIGVLRANGIGDFLMAVPALTALRRAYPLADITILGDAWLPGLLDGRPGPWNGCVAVPRYPGLRGAPVEMTPGPEVGQFVRRHRGRYDVVLQLHGGGRTSNAFVNLLAPRLAVGSRTPDAAALDRWTPYRLHQHEVLRWLEVVSLLGARGPHRAEDLVPRLELVDSDTDESRSVWPREEPPVVFHVGSRDRRRQWPAGRFAELGHRLAADGLGPVLLVGGPGDEPVSREVARNLGHRASDLTGRLSLGGLLGLLSRSRVLVGNDSGPRHLATAVGTPTVGIFWVGNALTFAPLLRQTDEVLVAWRSDCPRCGEPQVSARCGHDDSFLTEVDVDTVHRAVLSVLGFGSGVSGTREPGSSPAQHRP